MRHRNGSLSLLPLAIACLLGSLTLVAWRQSRALELLGELDGLRREQALERADQDGLMQQIGYLESRARVVREAQDRIGLRLPDDSELVFLQSDPR